MIKVLLFYGTSKAGQCYGFSETQWYLPSNDFTACQVATKKLVQLRSALMGDGIDFFGFRMSVDGDPRNAKFVPSGNMVSRGLEGGSGPANKAATPADIPNTCINLRCGHNNQRHKQIYLNGIPDAIIRTAPVGPNMAIEPGWQQKYNAWRDYLKVGGTWGFKARKLNPDKTNVIDYTQQAAGGGYLGAITNNDIANVGDQVQLRKVKRINAALPKVNGTYYISEKATDAVAGTFTYFLRGTSLLDPNNIADPGTIELVEYQGFAYTCIEISSQTTRKRGVGSLRPRGRSSNRAG